MKSGSSIRGFWMTIVLALAVLAAGCGKPQETATGPSGESKPTKATTAGKRSGIAIVPKAIAGEYWIDCQKGAEKAAKELGVELTFTGPTSESDVSGQIAVVENLINKNIAAIGISPCSADGLNKVVAKALRMGIPVVTLDSDTSAKDRLCYIGTNNRAAGAVAARTLAALIGDKGKVGVVTGVAGANNLEERYQGFVEEMKKHPNITVLPRQAAESDKSLAISITENLLTAHPDLAGIFGVNAISGPGVGQAVRASGKAGKVKVVSFDVTPELQELCKAGAVQALIAQRPFKMGYLAVKVLYDALHGKKPTGDIDTGVEVVTREKLLKAASGKQT